MTRDDLEAAFNAGWNAQIDQLTEDGDSSTVEDSWQEYSAGIKLPEPPLLQCTDCKNTESPAGAMARMFNHGRCVHCGGYFKVVRA